jgi:hypothetical protein
MFGAMRMTLRNFCDEHEERRADKKPRPHRATGAFSFLFSHRFAGS